MKDMEYRFEVTYFVMDAETEATLAMTKDEKVVEFMKNNYPTPVIVRPSVVKKIKY